MFNKILLKLKKKKSVEEIYGFIFGAWGIFYFIVTIYVFLKFEITNTSGYLSGLGIFMLFLLFSAHLFLTGLVSVIIHLGLLLFKKPKSQIGLLAVGSIIGGLILFSYLVYIEITIQNSVVG